MNPWDKYLRIVMWAERRYMACGRIVLSINEQPTRYSMIERLAWRKYLAPARAIRAAIKTGR